MENCGKPRTLEAVGRNLSKETNLKLSCPWPTHALHMPYGLDNTRRQDPLHGLTAGEREISMSCAQVHSP